MTMAPFKRVCEFLGVSSRTCINLKSQKKIDWLVHQIGLDGKQKKELWVDVERLELWFRLRGAEFPVGLAPALARWSISVEKEAAQV